MAKVHKMRRKVKDKKLVMVKILPCIMVLIIFMLSIGWATFSQKLLIDDIGFTVRVQADIRVTGISVSNDDYFNTNNATSNWEEYNVKHIQTSVNLPEKSSQIKYKIQVTNFGNVEMGIFNITGLPNNLEYKLENYNLKEKICIENNCKLGIQKDFYIIIKYKDGEALPDNTNFIIDLDFDFRPFHKITYVNFDSDYTSSYPKEIIDGETFRMELKQPFPIGAKPFQDGIAANYKFDNDTLVVENVTGDLAIHSRYIQTIEDLVTLSNNVEEGNTYSGTTFILDRNLDFNSPASYRNSSRTDFGDINENSNDEALITELSSGTGFKPIGILISSDEDVDIKFFEGNFDGANHSISNLYVKKPAIFTAEENVNIGLFGYINNSNISNLKVDGEIEIQDLGSDIINRGGAGLIGSARGTSNLLNIENHVNVKTSSGRDKVGGVVGETAAGLITIKNCKNYGNISNSNQTGGILAYNGTDGEVYIENCENYGIILNEKGSTAIGGIIGHSTDSSIKTTIKNSRNHGKISTGNSIANEQKLGGIAGNIYGELLIEDCENYGEIIVEDTTAKPAFSFNGGGILGRKTGGNGVIKNCHNYANITGQYRLGGIVGHANTGGTVTIVNSSNSGTLTEIAAVSSSGASGGIMGAFNSGCKINILNSYNTGNITSYEGAAGILGNIVDSNSANAVNIVNSYNIGNVTANIYAGGIINDSYSEKPGNAVIKLNNVYNLGTLNGKSGSYGIGSATTNHSIVNTYYQNSYADSHYQGYIGTAMDVNNMKNQSFVDRLNSNINGIDLPTIDSNFNGYKVSTWTLDSNGYPTLVN